jgi:glycosyltransferase involved in cell wall biosynthesis
MNMTALLDSRMPLPCGLAKRVKCERIYPSILGRLNAERMLAKLVRKNDTVLCFGNLPPLFKVQGRVVVFVQNRYLIESVSLSEFSLKIRLRLILEKLWLFVRARGVSEFVVQTESMKLALGNYLQFNNPASSSAISVLPFVSMPPQRESECFSETNDHCEHFDFVYIASGEPHKNHRRLIEAWILLASEGHFPTLALTLNEKTFPELSAWIVDQASEYDLRVKNLGQLSFDEVIKLYKHAGALIFPSKLESFGLPLIEAMQFGLPVIASELDYVRDILDPAETFNPESPVSIAKAVKRFSNWDKKRVEIMDASVFLERVINSGQ